MLLEFGDGCALELFIYLEQEIDLGSDSEILECLHCDFNDLLNVIQVKFYGG
jgi:hypothetical protein